MAEFEAAEEAAEDDGMALPTRQNDEFRPFIRRYDNILVIRHWGRKSLTSYVNFSI